MTDVTDDRRRTAQLLLLAAFLHKELRDALKPSMEPRDTIAVYLDDGTFLGTVNQSKEPSSVIETDPQATLAWCRTNRPDEVVEVVRPSYVKHLKALCADAGHAYDEVTGEIIPGFELGKGEPRLTPRVDPDAKRYVFQPLLAQLIEKGTLELPAADGDGSTSSPAATIFDPETNPVASRPGDLPAEDPA